MDRIQENQIDGSGAAGRRPSLSDILARARQSKGAEPASQPVEHAAWSHQLKAEVEEVKGCLREKIEEVRSQGGAESGSPDVQSYSTEQGVVTVARVYEGGNPDRLMQFSSGRLDSDIKMYLGLNNGRCEFDALKYFVENLMHTAFYGVEIVAEASDTILESRKTYTFLDEDAHQSRITIEVTLSGKFVLSFR